MLRRETRRAYRLVRVETSAFRLDVFTGIEVGGYAHPGARGRAGAERLGRKAVKAARRAAFRLLAGIAAVLTWGADAAERGACRLQGGGRR